MAGVRKALAIVYGLVEGIRLRHAIRQRRLLGHLSGQRLIDRGVVVNPVAGAHHRGMLRKRPPSDADARLELVIIGTKQCRRDSPPGWPSVHWDAAVEVGAVAHTGRLRSEAGPDIQIHQAVVQFGDGRLKVPAQSDIDAEVALDAPIVVHESIQPGGRGNICRRCRRRWNWWRA